MKKKILFWALLMLLFCIIACKKNCKQFHDEQLLPWISFVHPESLKYTNQFGDTIQFSNGIRSESEGYSIVNDMSSPCTSYACYLALVHHPFSKILVSLGRVRSDLQISFFVAFSIDSNAINGNIVSYVYTDKIVGVPGTINGIFFNESYTLEMDTTESLYPERGSRSNDVWKCILVKDHGVMQFYEKSGTIWTLVE